MIDQALGVITSQELLRHPGSVPLDPPVSPHLDEGRAHPTVGSSRSPSRTRIRDERALMATGAGVYPALR